MPTVHDARQAWRAVVAMLSGGEAVVCSHQGVSPAALAHAARYDDAGAVLASSGVTGRPKTVALSRSALVAAAIASREALGGDHSWTLALPHRHVAGLMVLVRAALAGVEPRHARTDLSDAEPGPSPSAISIVATQLHRALGSPQTTARLAAYDHVLVGGSAVDAGLLAAARAEGVRARVTYGMTETCGGCVHDGRALARALVEVREHPGCAPGEGRVHIAGPQLFTEYVGAPEATREALVDGWFATSDRGRLIDGELVVTGRLDDVVVSGGVSVDLAAVQESVSRLSPTALVWSVPDPEWGAEVVLVAQEPTDLAGWREALAVDLPRTSLPRRLVRVASPPRNQLGKPDRAALERLLGVRAENRDGLAGAAASATEGDADGQPG